MRELEFILLESNNARYENMCLFYLPLHGVGVKGGENHVILIAPFLYVLLWASLLRLQY